MDGRQWKGADLRLWYRQPAKDWNEALPVGNGSLGAMIFGMVKSEKIQLNEDSVWYGGPIDRNNKDALTYLDEIRQLLINGQLGKAEELAKLALSGTPESQRHYQPLGALYLDFEYHDQEVENYQRELDMMDGLVKITYTMGEVKYTREIFATNVDHMLVIRITADKPRSISFKACLRRGRYLDYTLTDKNGDLIMMGKPGGEKGIKFCSLLRVANEGGENILSVKM